MTKSEQKFFDRAMIDAMTAIINKLPIKYTTGDDPVFRGVAFSAGLYATELLKERRKHD